MTDQYLTIDRDRAEYYQYEDDIRDMLKAGVLLVANVQQETERTMQACGDTHPRLDVYHPDGHVKIRTRWVTRWEEQDV